MSKKDKFISIIGRGEVSGLILLVSVLLIAPPEHKAELLFAAIVGLALSRLMLATQQSS